MNTRLVFASVLLIAISLGMPSRSRGQSQVRISADQRMQNRLRIDSALRRMKSEDQQTRIDAFYDLTSIYSRNEGTIQERVRKLLRAHPERSEYIKQGLFAAAKDSRALVAACEEGRTENCDENVSEYWANSIFGLRMVRDPRVVDALLSGPGHGGLDADLLAEFLPYAVDPVIRKLQAPVNESYGVPYSERWAAFSVLEECLTRQALMRAHPEAVTKIRQALLNATDDADPNTRTEAAQALANFREDPEIRARLLALAQADTYMAKDIAGKKNEKTYPVRAAAARSLDPVNDSELLYVMRVPETGECRVQRGDEQPAGEIYIGPIRRGDGKRQMCSHFEPESRDPFLCWKVFPQNTCEQ